MNKQELIEKFLNEPLKVGDKFSYPEFDRNNKIRYDFAEAIKIDDQYVYYEKYGWHELQKALLSEIKKDVSHLGYNPFVPELRHQKYSIDIDQLISRCGYERDGKSKMEQYFNVNIPEVCFDPMVFDENGNEVEYQRGLVWTLEQKQLLIESIYNNIEIGKFVFRERSFNWVEKRVKEGKLEHTAFKDLVDGKQRFHAIFGFINNEFSDLNGAYYNDLSNTAQRHFRGYSNLMYIQMDEKTTDKDVLSQFLAINFTGVPMSRDHIEFVKNIKIK
jgi:hypothetical protein